MKRSFFVALFLTTQAGFIFLQVYKHSYIINQTYRKQEAEKMREQLAREKQRLLQLQCQQHNRADVAEFAKKQLNMVSIKLHQIKKLNA